mmetsp:Transcript_3872/g.5067  ORF Transcript_3872/g.5067 Transcript_3872/m.5067 type:complete len:166 (+) Transcript_3872:46-543(+)
MANAAAKKAAAAKQQTNSFYLPLIVSLNFLHIFLLFILSSQTFTKTRIFITVIEWIGTYISYQGILHDAETGKLTRDKKDTKLSGGIYLDILGLILFVQYGSMFIGGFVDWLLLFVPVSYGIYYWFSKRDKSGTDNKESGQDDEQNKELDERRRKRAERRRQKRA